MRHRVAASLLASNLVAIGLSALVLYPTPGLAQPAPESCTTTVMCARTAIRVAADAQAAAGQLTSRLAASETEVARQEQQIAALTAQVQALKSGYNATFKGQGAKGSCSLQLGVGDNRPTLPAGAPGNATGVNWCPANTYVAGTVSYKGNAQDFGVVCCPLTSVP